MTIGIGKSGSLLAAALVIQHSASHHVQAAVNEATDPRTIASNEYLTLTDAIAPVAGGSVVVNGQLVVANDENAFTPATFTLKGNGEDLALAGGTTADTGHGFQGRAVFDGGTIQAGAIAVGPTAAGDAAALRASNLIVNTLSGADSVVNRGQIDVNSTFTVGGDFDSDYRVFLRSGAVSAASFVSAGPGSNIGGEGTISAGSITLSGTYIEPAAAATLTFDSAAPVSLDNTSFFYFPNPEDPSTSSELAFTGDATLGGSITAVFLGYGLADVIGKQFEVANAATLSGAFEHDPEDVLLQITSDGDPSSEAVGRMELKYTPTLAYFEFAAVPEPTAFLAGVGVGGAALLRRRRR